ncbi:MAG: response regulator transcription factor [Gammaproteobacteria bacterium]|nr:response regulator transcription factor [Gammaproteobacteria bacterium]
MKILIADDEKALLSFLERGLRTEGYDCICADQLHEVSVLAQKHQPTIIILDRMFQDEDSLGILQDIRRKAPGAMILLLTALDEVSDRVAGLKQGADDYLCKPFDFEELLARIESLARRAGDKMQTLPPALIIGQLRLDRENRLAFRADEELVLTKIEFDLLLYFAENLGKVLSRERILNRVWGSQSDPLTNIVDVYISRLRQKIDAPHTESLIQTLRGNGYRMRVGD